MSERSPGLQREYDLNDEYHQLMQAYALKNGDTSTPEGVQEIQNVLVETVRTTEALDDQVRYKYNC